MKKKNNDRSFLSYLSYIIIVFLIAVLITFFLFSDVAFPFDLPFKDDVINFLDSAGLNTDKKIDEVTAESPEETIGQMDVYVIDVGQGSSTLFVSDNRCILIDTGENGNGEKIVSLITSLGFNSIDMLIGTHPHSDHIGGMDEVLELINVENIILPKLPSSIIPTTKTYLDVLKTIDNQGKTIIPANLGDSFEIGNMHLEIFGPVIGVDDNLNNYSVISKITAGGGSVLVTGDAESSAENLLLKARSKLKSDIYIVGHHGSNTSSTDEFINAVYPTYAALSVGYNNSYGHPNDEVLNRLYNINCDVFRTDEDGTIVFSIKDNFVTVESDKH